MIIKVDLNEYRISMEYLTGLSEEFMGHLLQATPGERALEYEFENEDYGKQFEKALESFKIKKS